MRMNAALYFPFIRGRDGELQALSLLSPVARARMTPVVDMPTPKESASLSADIQINSFVSRVVRAWGTQYPVYLDMSRFPSDFANSRGLPAVEHMFACAAQLKALAIPVTGPLAERGPGTQYLDAITRIAARDGRGAAFRIAHEDFSDADILDLTRFGGQFLTSLSVL
jgi:hypothetical protein